MSLTRIRRRRSLGRPSTRKVGSSNVNELCAPAGYPKLEVFADTETYYETLGLEPWNWIGKEGCMKVLSAMPVKPILLAWQYGLEEELMKECKYIDGSLDVIHYFLGNLEWIYNTLRMTPVLYFHNSSYDIPVLAPLFKKLDPDMILYFYAVRDSGNFIRGCMQLPKYNLFCEFGDTMKYDRTMSIERAGKILGKPKLEDFPYGMCDPRLEEGMIVFRDIQNGEEKRYPLDKSIEYAVRDVDIMREIHHRRKALDEKLNREMMDWENMNQALFRRRTTTRPQHCKIMCNEHLKSLGLGEVDTIFRFDLKNEYDTEDVKDIYRRTIESNNGGFTSFNRHVYRYECDNTHEIRYYDVNSMYPWVMTGRIPYGSITTERPEGAHVVWYCVVIKSCKWKGGMECLNNQAFSQEKLAGRPFFVEGEYWAFVLDNCEIDYELEGIYYQKSDFLLKSFITKLFDKRAAIKKEMKNHTPGSTEYSGLKDLEEGLKLLMNSLYGKMCERGYHVNKVYNELRFEIFENTEKNYPCILTGSYITSKSRLKLLTKIREIIDAGYDFLYADTDSVIFGAPKKADLGKIFPDDQGKLGEWKLESVGNTKTWDLFLSVWKKKKYVLANRKERQHKKAFSGVPKRIHRIIDGCLERDFERTLDDLGVMLSPHENIIMKNVKPISFLNDYGQTVIFNGDYSINSHLKDPTGYLRIVGDNYVLEKNA